MQLPVDLQEAAAAALEVGSYGYGSITESGYGYSSSSSEADTAAGLGSSKRMLLQQTDASAAPLLQPGSYSNSSSVYAIALTENAAAGSYGGPAADTDEGLGYGSARRLLQQVDATAGSYGSADATPAGSYTDAAALTAEGLYGSMRRLLQDSTGAADSYGSAPLLTQSSSSNSHVVLVVDVPGKLHVK
jgi:hypothetical protein